MTPRSVLILGAPRSGKTWLAQTLFDALAAKGLPVTRFGVTSTVAQTPMATAPAHWRIEEASRLPHTQDPMRTTLLMGMDLPGLDTGLQLEDSLLRQSLALAATPFRVVYGTGMARLNNALLALGLPGEEASTWLERESHQYNINRGRDAWVCNACSDPGCEHQLFTGLLARRSG